MQELYPLFCQIDDRNSIKIPLCLSNNNKTRARAHTKKNNRTMASMEDLHGGGTQPCPRLLVGCAVGMDRCLHDTQHTTVDNLHCHVGDTSMAMGMVGCLHGFGGCPPWFSSFIFNFFSYFWYEKHTGIFMLFLLSIWQRTGWKSRIFVKPILGSQIYQIEN